MYQVIARKYRPFSFGDLVNQKHVRTTLENAISQNRIAHGYIFSGQRGTGKTTVARIVARCLNCAEGPTIQPCGKCPSCVEITAGNAVDVIEIDAASNRGINEIRELRENVRYRPARGRYKVFIIDEAHQITNEAFNALLKTLEEPPEWVVFILCTTETHKIPATISSRCQQFSFRAVDFEEIIERMAWICGQENIEADSEVLAVLAQAGEGSVRDSLSALDQAIACCGNKLNAAEVRRLLGLFSLEAMHQVTAALTESNPGRMLEIVDELERSGQNLQYFCRELARFFRNLLVVRIAGAETRLVAASPRERARLAEIASFFGREDLTRYLQLILSLFQELQYSTQPRLHLELGLIKMVEFGRLLPIEEVLAGLEPGSGGSAPASGGGKSSSGRGNSYSASPIEAAPAPPARENPPAERVGRQAESLPPTPPPADPPPMVQEAPAAVAAELDEPGGLSYSPDDSAPAPAPWEPGPEDDEPPVDFSSDSEGYDDFDARADEIPMPAAPPTLQTRLRDALRELGLPFTADAVQHSEIEEAGSAVVFRTPKQFSLAMSEPDLRKAFHFLDLSAARIRIEYTAALVEATAESGQPQATDEELLKRALENPEVQRFQELFGGQIRDVFNLRV